uniref:Uncharacterized protein n=1 Tax=Cannabis sativa TaxID=3483 RepID=A0A803PKJ0_CANSA
MSKPKASMQNAISSRFPKEKEVVFGQEAVEMAFALCKPLETQVLGENLFPDDVKDANTAEVPEGTSKVVDNPKTPIA